MDSGRIPAEVEAFFQLLEDRRVPYLLVGGMAMLAYVRGRNTDGIDLVISTPDQTRLAPEVTILQREGFFALGRFQASLRVDFLGAENPIFALVSRKYAGERAFEFLSGGRRIPCATPEGLILIKLYALPLLHRQDDFERTAAYASDLGKLLAAYPGLDTEQLLSVLTNHDVLPSDVEELRRLLLNVRPRLDRFQTGASGD